MHQTVLKMKRLLIYAIAIALVIIVNLESFDSTVDNWEDLADDLANLERCTSCPHERFITHHICPYCNTLEEAATFTRLIRGHNTMKNTVLLGSPNFELKTYRRNRCGNTNAVKIAICEFMHNSQEFQCKLLGNYCYCEHSTVNGHLFFKEIKCSQ